MNRPTTLLGRLLIGRVPRVVGTISTPGLSSSNLCRFALECHIAELRLDLLGQKSDWLGLARACEGFGRPVLATVRLASEGGRWTGSEADRRAIFRRGVDYISGIDVEAGTPLADELAGELKAAGKVLLLSYHNFQRTPSASELGSIILSAAASASIVKITTMVTDRRDLTTFVRLLQEPWPVPICLMGMGPLGRETRTLLPRLGSCLTYGYLDQPVAPGQPRASEILADLKKSVEVRKSVVSPK